MIERLICWVRGHTGSPLERLSDQAVKVHCERCDRVFAYHHVNGWLLPWSIDLAEFYRTWPELTATNEIEDREGGE